MQLIDWVQRISQLRLPAKNIGLSPEYGIVSVTGWRTVLSKHKLSAKYELFHRVKAVEEKQRTLRSWHYLCRIHRRNKARALCLQRRDANIVITAARSDSCSEANFAVHIAKTSCALL